jgi:WD40 repeat protein/transcriptional regulator with XRE-family HTH domain
MEEPPDRSDRIDPRQATTLLEFAHLLRALCRRPDSPSLKDISKRCHLSRSALDDYLAGRRLPRRDALQRLLSTCDLPEQEYDSWLEVVDRLKNESRAGDPSAKTPANQAVFISCMWENAKQGQDLAELLRERKLTVWYDQQQVKPGARLPSSLEEMAQAKYIVLIISPQSAQSARSRREWSEALNITWQDPSATIFPILVDDAGVPSFLVDHRVSRARTEADLPVIANAICGSIEGRRDFGVAENSWHSGWRIDNGRVHQLSFSPDGMILITAEDDGAARLWSLPTATLLSSLSNQSDAIDCAACSPDGLFAATGSRDGTVRVWDMATRTVYRSMTGDRNAIKTVSFSPDGYALACVEGDRHVRIWDIATGLSKAVLSGPSAVISSIAFSPDSRLLAVAGDEGEVQFWDATANVIRSSIRRESGDITTCTFSPDGRLLAIAGAGSRVDLWDLAAGAWRPPFHTASRSSRCTAFTPDGKFLAVGSGETARVWDVTTGIQIAKLRHDGQVKAIGFSPDGLYLAISDNSSVRGWQIPATLARLRLSEIEADAYALRPSGDDLQHARELLTQLTDVHRYHSEPDTPSSAEHQVSLAIVMRAQGDLDGARALLTEALAAQRRILGSDHVSVATTLVNLADIARRQDRLEEARALLTEALAAQRRIFGPDHVSVATTLVNLADIARRQDRLEEARALLLQAIEISKPARTEHRSETPEWSAVRSRTQEAMREIDAIADSGGASCD